MCKSGSFALQNLRFRNVKSKLSFSFRIIFIKSGRFPYIVSKVSKDSKKNDVPYNSYTPKRSFKN